MLKRHKAFLALKPLCGPHRMNSPGCGLHVDLLTKRHPGDRQAIRSPKPSFLVQPRPTTAVHTLKAPKPHYPEILLFRPHCHVSNEDTKILQTFIFFKSKQFKIGLPFHIFIQSRLMCPCLYYIFHPCHL